MDHVALFNELIKVIKVVGGENIRAKSKDDSIVDIGLDSLDIVMLHMYISELYGLDDEEAKNIPTDTVESAFAYAEQHGKRRPSSIDEVREAVK